MIETTDRVAEANDSASIAAWVDAATSNGGDLSALIGKLTEWTLPSRPWTMDDPVNPLRGDLDPQLWFWNRAANNYLDRSLHQEAAEVWSAQYLAILSLQVKFHQRYNKGMSLCNIGYAFAKAGRARLAIRCWTFGIVEEALSDLSSAGFDAIYENMIQFQVSPDILDEIVTKVRSRFSDQFILPLFPELAFAFCGSYSDPAALETCMNSIDHLSGMLLSHYPSQPDASSPWENVLAPYWGDQLRLEGL